MRRLSPRRLFLYLVCAVSSILLFINIEQRLSSGPIPVVPSRHLNLESKAEESLSRKLTGNDSLQQKQEANADSQAAVAANEAVAGDTGNRTDTGDSEVDKEPRPDSDTNADEHNEVEFDPPSPRPPMTLDRKRIMPAEDNHPPSEKEKPWYMKEGQLRPRHANSEDVEVVLWPEDAPLDDRIPDQLMHVPPHIPVDIDDQASLERKKILLWNGLSSWGGVKPGREVFLREGCPVTNCDLVTDRTEAAEADLILFKDHYSQPTIARSPSQVWMLYLLECPLHTQVFRHGDLFNWTATYRTDSTIVAPYERWQLFNENVKTLDQGINYAANKTKKVAWFVSNCGARRRLDYVQELRKYIDVDVYGRCGELSCPRSDSSRCFSMLNSDYKFYLAFENSNCQDYITEKFFVNGLGHNVLPIAMGARLDEYLRAAPHKSFLHVDMFEDPKELAEYLHYLDENDDKYNEYFQWKGTGEFINTKFFCRVCTLLNTDKERKEEHKSYEDINNWWRGEGVCTNGPWRYKKKDFKQSLALVQN